VLIRCKYRVGQFFMRLGVGQAPIDPEAARSLLPEAAFALFDSMSPGDQAHALCVLRVLRQGGAVADDVAEAALLHDVGKAGSGLTLPHRVLIVLLRWLDGGLLESLATEPGRNAPLPGSWRYPFHAQAHHAELGAQRCAQVGCSPSTVALVAHHEASAHEYLSDPALRAKLMALQRADECC